MNTFGLKTFFRAIALFMSVYIVKIGIDWVTQTNDPFLKMVYTIAIVVVVLLILFAPNLIPTIRRENPNKDRNSKK